MTKLPKLFDNNKQWAERLKQEDPTFFEESAKGQAPEYLWVGCADSRAPAAQLLGLKPGEVFVHRNVANLVVANDINFLSVLQYAVDALKVRHIIICGHTCCGGVEAAYEDKPLGLIDNWIRPVQQLSLAHKAELDAIEDRAERLETLVKLNIKTQVLNVAHTPTVQQAWKRGQDLTVHGWIYELASGHLKDLDFSFDGSKALPVRV